MIALLLLGLALNGFVPTLQTGDTVPPLPLVDQDGRAFSFADLRGNVVVVSFLFTACGDVNECPLLASKLGHMQSQIGAQPIRLVAITLDPEHDTPPRLLAFGKNFGADAARWRLATGAPPVVDELIARFGMTGLRRDAGNRLVHDEEVVVLDRSGRIATTISGNRWAANDVLAIARTYAGTPIDRATAVRLWLSAAAEQCGRSAGAFTQGGALSILAVAMAGIGLAFGWIFSSRGS